MQLRADEMRALSLICPGIDPLTFFMSILRNIHAPLELRMMAAERAIPFTSPKLASIEARSGGKTHEDRLAMLQAMDIIEEEPQLKSNGVGGVLEPPG